MKSWKNQWKAELNNVTPKLRRDVVDAPINAATNAREQSAQPAARRKPFWYGLSSSIAAVLLVVVLCVTLIPSNGGNVDAYAFVVEINPAITVSADKNGNVTGLIASNADADVILSDTDAVNALKGRPVGEAVEWYVDASAKLGYLDVSKQSAIRVSALSGGDLLTKVSDGLEAYFKQNGVLCYVISDVVSVDVFAQRCGASAFADVKTATDYVTTAEPVFAARSVEGETAEQLKQTYEDYIDGEGFCSAIGAYLDGIVDNVNERRLKLAQMQSLYERISQHADNPGILSKDYWHVSSFYSDKDFTQDFAELMREMDGVLLGYKTSFNDEITSKLQLDMTESTLSALPVDEIVSLLQSLTVDALRRSISVVSQVLQAIGIEYNPVESLTSPPTDFDAFVSKMRDVATVERAYRETRFKDVYNQAREQLSDSDYLSFKQSLLNEYGSADNLWQNLK